MHHGRTLPGLRDAILTLGVLLVSASTSQEESAKDEEPQGSSKVGLWVAVGGVILLTCLLFVCMCCIFSLKRPRDESLSALQIAEEREREQEEEEERERHYRQAEEASAEVSLGMSADCEVMEWNGGAENAGDCDETATIPSCNAEVGKADEMSVQSSIGSDRQTGEMTGSLPCERGHGLPSSEPTTNEVSDLKICWVEEEVQEDRCIDGCQESRGPSSGAQHLSCCPSLCQSKASKQGVGRAVWKECALARIVSL